MFLRGSLYNAAPWPARGYFIILWINIKGRTCRVAAFFLSHFKTKYWQQPRVCSRCPLTGMLLRNFLYRLRLVGHSAQLHQSLDQQIFCYTKRGSTFSTHVPWVIRVLAALSTHRKYIFTCSLTFCLLYIFSLTADGPQRARL